MCVSYLTWLFFSIYIRTLKSPLLERMISTFFDAEVWTKVCCQWSLLVKSSTNWNLQNIVFNLRNLDLGHFIKLHLLSSTQAIEDGGFRPVFSWGTRNDTQFSWCILWHFVQHVVKWNWKIQSITINRLTSKSVNFLCKI